MSETFTADVPGLTEAAAQLPQDNSETVEVPAQIEGEDEAPKDLSPRKAGERYAAHQAGAKGRT